MPTSSLRYINLFGIISYNRDLRLKNGRHWTIRHTNPCPPDEEVAEVGPIDPEIGILRAWRDIPTKGVRLNVISEAIELLRRRDIPERIMELRQEQADLLESLHYTTLNFKSFLPVYQIRALPGLSVGLFLSLFAGGEDPEP